MMFLTQIFGVSKGLLCGLSAFCVLASNGSASQAACALSLVSASKTLAVNYDPFNAAPARAFLSLQIKNGGDKACDGAVVFQKNAKGAGASGQTVLHYTIEAPNVTAQGAGLPSFQIKTDIVGMGPGETRTVGYGLSIQPGQMLAPDDYTDVIDVGVSQAAGSSPLRTGPSTVINLKVAVQPVMSINVAGAGTVTTLDFGVLFTGASRSVILQARTNQRYRLSVSSDNRGVLKLDPRAMDGVDWAIPYSVRLDNRPPLILKNVQRLDSAKGPTPLSGLPIPIEVVIGDTASQRAGRYRDVIVVSIEAAP